MALEFVKRYASPLAELAEEVGEVIHLPDPIPLYCVLAAEVTARLSYTPLWIMLVGPSGDGKTLALRTLTRRPHVVWKDVLTVPALLSGTPNKEKIVGATGGVLYEIGARGTLVLKDFTNILDLHKDKRGELMGALRNIHDGDYDRPVGSDGAKTLKWKGHLAFASACTPIIDRYSDMMANMGLRFVYVRLMSRINYKGAEMAARGKRGEADGKLAELGKDYLEVVDERIGVCGVPEPSAEEVTRMVSMGVVGSRLRSPVPREGYCHEITEPPSCEAPTKISAMCGSVWRSLKLLGASEEELWDVLERITVDSAPAFRSMVVRKFIATHNREMSAGDVRELTQCSPSAVTRFLEDMQVQGMLDTNAGLGGRRWRIGEEFWEEWRRAFG